MAKDQATLDALAGALPSLMTEPISQLQGRRLDSEFFNGLVAPDATGLLLRWLSDPEAFKQRRSDAEWKAFCQQCKTDAGFDPVKDGPLKAAELARGAWQSLEQGLAAFCRGAGKLSRHRGMAEAGRTEKLQACLIPPKSGRASTNSEERQVAAGAGVAGGSAAGRGDPPGRRTGSATRGAARLSMAEAGAQPAGDGAGTAGATGRVCARQHPARRPRRRMPTFYASDGWRVDAAALATMAACGSPEQHGAVLGTVRAVYLPWLENTARHLQQLIHDNGQSVSKRAKPIEAAAGRLVLFADGLRMDVAQQLAEKLAAAGIESTQDWEWSAIPSVTATAKPAASPIADAVQGGDASDEFATRLVSTGQLLTQDRFVTALKERGWQFLGSDETGDPSGSAWTEAGALDKRGHTEGWKLARSVETEVRDLVSRIGALLKAGWTEVVVVTDHGWLLVPGGLPKVELKAFLAETPLGPMRRVEGRCPDRCAGVQVALESRQS